VGRRRILIPPAKISLNPLNVINLYGLLIAYITAEVRTKGE
jgi:hypothetical protein